MVRHDLVLNINIGRIKNSGDTYTWVKNIFIINVIWFDFSTVNNILRRKPNIYIKNLSIHMLMSFFVANSRACDSMFSQFVVYALLLSK